MEKYIESHSLERIPHKRKGRGKSRLERAIWYNFIKESFTRPIRPLDKAKIQINLYTDRNLSNIHIFHILQYISEGIKEANLIIDAKYKTIGPIKYCVKPRSEGPEKTEVIIEGKFLKANAQAKAKKPKKKLFSCLMCEEEINKEKYTYCKNCRKSDVLRFA